MPERRDLHSMTTKRLHGPSMSRMIWRCVHPQYNQQLSVPCLPLDEVRNICRSPTHGLKWICDFRSVMSIPTAIYSWASWVNCKLMTMSDIYTGGALSFITWGTLNTTCEDSNYNHDKNGFLNNSKTDIDVVQGDFKNAHRACHTILDMMNILGRLWLKYFSIRRSISMYPTQGPSTPRLMRPL